MAIASVGIFYLFAGWGAAIFIAVVWLVSGPLGMWLGRKWGTGT